MNKTVKILLIIIMLGLFIVSFSYATDINMNLPVNSITSSSNTIANSENTTNTNVLNQTYSNQATSFQNETIQNSVVSDTQSTRVSTSYSTQNETLGFTNILNILLIVVGVVLILLGIAILIRMHS